jgi:hypothetical protein
MCNNATKQEILTLIALAQSPGPKSENRLISEVAKLAVQVGWPQYLDHLPMPLHERCKEISVPPLNCALRVKTRYWASNSNTTKQLTYLIDTHAPEKLRKKLMELMPVPA